MAKASQILADVQRAADAHVTLDDSLAQVCNSPSLMLSYAIYIYSCSACLDQLLMNL